MQFGNVSGAVIVGDGNTVNQLTIHADSDSNVIVHTGPLPDPVKRHPISQLPRPATEPLIGREEDLQTLRAALGANKVVQLWGTAGVGKSALLRHLACTLPGGSDGVAYIEAGGRTADDIAQAIFDISFDAPNYKPSAEVLKQHLETLYLRIYLDDTGLDHAELRRSSTWPSSPRSSSPRSSRPPPTECTRSGSPGCRPRRGRAWSRRYCPANCAPTRCAPSRR